MQASTVVDLHKFRHSFFVATLKTNDIRGMRRSKVCEVRRFDFFGAQIGIRNSEFGIPTCRIKRIRAITFVDESDTPRLMLMSATRSGDFFADGVPSDGHYAAAARCSRCDSVLYSKFVWAGWRTAAMAPISEITSDKRAAPCTPTLWIQIKLPVSAALGVASAHCRTAHRCVRLIVIFRKWFNRNVARPRDDECWAIAAGIFLCVAFYFWFHRPHATRWLKINEHLEKKLTQSKIEAGEEGAPHAWNGGMHAARQVPLFWGRCGVSAARARNNQ